MMKLVFAVSASLLAVFSSAQTIDTYPGWNGTDHITGFGGENQNTAFGQSFTVAAPSTLLSYTSSLVLDNGTAFNVRLYVSAWDPATKTTVGGPLYTSGLLGMPGTVGSYSDLNVNPNLDLATGTYIAFYSTIGADLSTTSVGGIGTQYVGGKYAGGDFFAATHLTLAELDTNPWFTFSPGNDYDTIFRAEFQAVPEPASMLALGLGAAALLRRRRLMR